ncbi:MAG: hypothetical protein FJZ00_03690 [Candidatus Sericytochromatia bacterium]|uniref:BMC circularly permuted domain-containing protein n=1 Tax=Candidatus Tanganyikabacteria bacterium TaxID=2961651 RepID=A0A937X4U8_9BACT|nr:hypothetical protein [Candidatus Tanganyikabacteria bacterium]
MAELRTLVYLDVLQPQVAGFLGTVSQGYLPIEGQASIYVEIAPGMEINVACDAALKATSVQPGMLIVEREFGVLEAHSWDQGMVREAGRAIIDRLGLKGEDDRLKPVVISQQTITGIDPHHTMLVNRMRHGDLILKNQTYFVMETHPAGYAVFAANEAEKAADISVLEFRAFGAFGRVYLAGSEAEIEEAAKAAVHGLQRITGRDNKVLAGR